MSTAKILLKTKWKDLDLLPHWSSLTEEMHYFSLSFVDSPMLPLLPRTTHSDDTDDKDDSLLLPTGLLAIANVSVASDDVNRKDPTEDKVA